MTTQTEAVTSGQLFNVEPLTYCISIQSSCLNQMMFFYLNSASDGGADAPDSVCSCLKDANPPHINLFPDLYPTTHDRYKVFRFDLLKHHFKLQSHISLFLYKLANIDTLTNWSNLNTRWNIMYGGVALSINTTLLAQTICNLRAEQG